MKRMTKGTKITAIFIVLTMLMSISTGIMASEPESNSTIVEVASYEEDLGDGLVLRKILSLPENQLNSNVISRAGFSGTRTAYVTHQLFKSGNLQAEITAQATFFSTFTINCCYVQSKSYSIVKEGSYPFYLYQDISETVDDNVYGSVNYAQYSVRYTLSAFQNINKTMWVKCDANGGTSNNTSSYSLLPNENQVNVDGVTYTFG